jgi:hypothetical protein
MACLGSTNEQTYQGCTGQHSEYGLHVGSANAPSKRYRCWHYHASASAAVIVRIPYLHQYKNPEFLCKFNVVETFRGTEWGNADGANFLLCRRNCQYLYLVQRRSRSRYYSRQPGHRTPILSLVSESSFGISQEPKRQRPSKYEGGALDFIIDPTESAFRHAGEWFEHRSLIFIRWGLIKVICVEILELLYFIGEETYWIKVGIGLC